MQFILDSLIVICLQMCDAASNECHGKSFHVTGHNTPLPDSPRHFTKMGPSVKKVRAWKSLSHLSPTMKLTEDFGDPEWILSGAKNQQICLKKRNERAVKLSLPSFVRSVASSKYLLSTKRIFFVKDWRANLEVTKHACFTFLATPQQDNKPIGQREWVSVWDREREREEREREWERERERKKWKREKEKERERKRERDLFPVLHSNRSLCPSAFAVKHNTL